VDLAEPTTTKEAVSMKADDQERVEQDHEEKMAAMNQEKHE
jgi:hypothetical protein